MPIEVVTVGDQPLDASLDALVLAASEAMTNAAKFSGSGRVDLYAEARDGHVEVFVRDRGVGFDTQRSRRTGAGRATRSGSHGAPPRARAGAEPARRGDRGRAAGGTGDRCCTAHPGLCSSTTTLFQRGVRPSSATRVDVVGEAGTVAEAVAA